MRICLVSREVAPFWGAGIGVYVSLMARAWAAAGHEVHVLSEPHPGMLEDGPKSHRGVRFHAVDIEAGQCTLDGFRCHLEQHSMAVHEKLSELHAKHRFDYVEFPDFGGEGWLALKARRTLGAYDGAVMAIRLHTPLADCIELNADAMLDRETALILAIEGQALRDADALVSPCTSLLERVRSRYGPDVADDRKPGFVVPYAFDMASVEELGKGPAETYERPTILFYGRAERRKGVHLLVPAAQQLMDEGLDFDVRFIGGDTMTGPACGSMRRHLEKLASRAHAERFRFDPPRPRAELGPAIRGATACCFPSLWENYPNVCLEALALGKLVVGSNAGGMSEQIEDGVSGLLFESGSIESLKAALRRTLTDGDLREKVKATAPECVATACEPGRIVRETSAAIAIARERMEKTVDFDNAASVTSNGTTTPDASIIIPFYNMARWLPQTLESAKAQTHANTEIIVVDDGSTDPAGIAMIDQLDRDESVRVVRKRNGGLGDARNAGIAAARAQWVVPLDADDLLHPTFVAKTLHAARQPSTSSRPLAMVTSIVAAFPDPPGTHEDAPWVWLPLGLERDMLPAANVCSCCVALIEKDAIEAVGGYDAWLTSYEDWDFYCALASKGYRCEIVPERLIYYRQRQESMRHEIGEPNLVRFRALITQRHPRLAEHPEIALRILAGELRQHESVYLRNPRYQAIDRINAAFKRTPLHRPLKSLVLRTLGVGAMD
ncbi:MAG: glycosyltransferase [Phycisphaerales bacterium]|jgi:glycosyltransferase involved in cell wall biosynthesis